MYFYYFFYRLMTAKRVTSKFSQSLYKILIKVGFKIFYTTVDGWGYHFGVHILLAVSSIECSIRFQIKAGLFLTSLWMGGAFILLFLNQRGIISDITEGGWVYHILLILSLIATNIHIMQA